MKILFASRRPTYPFFLGGAEKSFFELAAALSRAGNSVILVGDYIGSVGLADHFFRTAHVEYTRWYEEKIQFLDHSIPNRFRLEMLGPDGVYVLHNFLPDFKPSLEDIIINVKPDLICTQLDGATEVLHVARNWDIPVLHFVRDVLNPVNFFALGIPQSMIGPRLCVVNSEFVGEYVRSHFPTDTVTIYPLVHLIGDLEEKNTGPRKRIVFVNPIPSKGGDVMYQVARELTEFEFELVPGWGMECGPEWLEIPNIIIHSWPVSDMGTVMARADLVVVPSQSHEAFGRTGIEAQIAGTPVVASGHSGIREALGDSALLVDDYENPAAWSAAIRSLLNNPKEIERLTAAGRVNQERFSEPRILEMFDHAVEIAMQLPKGNHPPA